MHPYSHNKVATCNGAKDLTLTENLRNYDLISSSRFDAIPSKIAASSFAKDIDILSLRLVRLPRAADLDSAYLLPPATNAKHSPASVHCQTL